MEWIYSKLIACTLSVENFPRLVKLSRQTQSCEGKARHIYFFLVSRGTKDDSIFILDVPPLTVIFHLHIFLYSCKHIGKRKLLDHQIKGYKTLGSFIFSSFSFFFFKETRILYVLLVWNSDSETILFSIRFVFQTLCNGVYRIIYCCLWEFLQQDVNELLYHFFKGFSLDLTQ